MITYRKFSEESQLACLYLAIATAIVSPISTALTSVLASLMLLAWLLSGQVLTSLKNSYQQPIGKMILLFFTWLLIGVGYTENSWQQGYDTISSWKKLALTFILIGLFYQPVWKQRFVNSYLLVMGIGAAIAIILWLTDVEVRGGGSNRRPGIFMTNYAAQSMAFIAAILVCVVTLAEDISIRKKVWVSGALLLLIFNVFYISGSRSGYLALPCVLVFVIYRLWGIKKRPLLVLGAGIVLVAILASSETLQSRVERAYQELSIIDTNIKERSETNAVGERMIWAKYSFELIQKKPIFGYGTSAFEVAYANNVANRFDQNNWHSVTTADPHNMYLFVLVENGVIGLLIFFGYIFVALREGLRGERSSYGLIGASFLLAICITSLFNSHFKTFPEGHLLAFFVGILLARNKSSGSVERV